MSRLDFEKVVLERSHQVPVVVDYWAAWCGPCRTLGPILEELAAAAAGRWELVKLDTEQEPELAMSHGIQGIPAVKMFQGGRAVAEFVGALPREEVQRWLEHYLPDPRLDSLRQLVARWEKEGARVAPALETFAADHPEMPEAKLRLAQALVGADPARARRLLADSGAEVEHADLVTDLGSLMELMLLDREPPAKMKPALDGARQAMRDHDLAGALDQLVDAAMIDRRFGDEIARRCAVALFRLLGHDHPLTRDQQRRLSMALHS